MNTNKRIPFNLKILDTCLPDYFQGFGGPVISFPVDARMTFSELFSKLTSDEAAWPANADIGDIRAAVTDLVGQVHREDQRPYSDIGPDEPPADYFVSCHPTISDMWIVIEKETGDVISSWPTKKEALVIAWGESGEELPADVYAYFGIELEVPEGYQVRFANEDAWSWSLGEGKEYENFFDTEMEAKVAAWKHHLAEKDFRGVAENYEQLHDGLSNMIESGRLTESDIPEDYVWLVGSLAHLASK